MRIAPLLSCVLWTSLAACDEDQPAFIDAAALDAPAVDGAANEIDAAVVIDAALAPMATVPATASVGTTCGVTPAPTTDLTIGNTGTAELVISAAEVTGGFTVVTTLPLTITPANTATLTIRAPVAVIGTDLGGSTKTGTLTLTTNQAGASPTVALTSLVTGANLALVNSSNAVITSVMFNATSGCPAPQTVNVRNTGNAVAAVGNASGSAFLFSGFSPNDVNPGGSISHTISLFTFSPCSGAEAVTYSVTGTVCTTTPLPLALTFNVGSGSGCVCS